jgi:YHS domain-containing protein
MLFYEPKGPAEYPTACGGKLREAEDHPSAEYRGRRVYFCRKACLRVFESDPERFMAGEIEHPLEEE